MFRSSLRALKARFLSFFGSQTKSKPIIRRRGTFCRLSIEPLEDRIAPVTDTFTNNLGGLWSQGSNWSLVAPPTSTQAAVVSIGSNGTVTHPSGSDTVAGLTSDGSLLVSGGSLTVNGTLTGTVNVSGSGQLLFSGTDATQGNVTINLSGGATVKVSGSLTNTGNTLTVSGSGTLVLSGTLTGGTVSLTNGATMVGQGGTLDGVTVSGNVTVSGSTLSVKDGLTLNGMLSLNSNASVYFAGSQTLGGSGQVVFGGTSNSTLYAEG